MFHDLLGKNGFKGADILKVTPFDRDNLSYIIGVNHHFAHYEDNTYSVLRIAYCVLRIACRMEGG